MYLRIIYLRICWIIKCFNPLYYVSFTLYFNQNFYKCRTAFKNKLSEFCVASLLIASSRRKREIYFLGRLRSASHTLHGFIGYTDRFSDVTFEDVRHRIRFFFFFPKFSSSQFLKECQKNIKKSVTLLSSRSTFAFKKKPAFAINVFCCVTRDAWRSLQS